MGVNDMKRKIMKIGNSFPQEMLERLNLEQGDAVKFQLEDDGTVSVKKFTPIDKDFLEGFQYAFENYDNALRNLAKR